MTGTSPHPNPFTPLTDAAKQVVAVFTDVYWPALRQIADETARLADALPTLPNGDDDDDDDDDDDHDDHADDHGNDDDTLARCMMY